MDIKKFITELRERTGAGFLACKKALDNNNGDIELAVKELLNAGAAKTDKLASRIAAEGVVNLLAGADNHSAAMVEINSETDFVARADDFQKFVASVSKSALDTKNEVVAELMETADADGKSLETCRQDLAARIGENIQVRRVCCMSSEYSLGLYIHGHRIGVMVALDVENQDLARDLAMHIAASKPMAISEADLSAETVAQQKEIFMAQSAASGKPEAIIEKMVAGKVAKYIQENTLLGQPFVKNPDQTIADLLKESGANVVAMQRYELGEGIEKQVSDFSEEVMSEVNKSRSAE